MGEADEMSRFEPVLRNDIISQITIWIYEYELKSRDKFYPASELSEAIVELIENKLGATV